MSSSTVADLASEQLARRLQEEEDQYAAFQLQQHLNSVPRFMPGQTQAFPSNTGQLSHFPPSVGLTHYSSPPRGGATPAYLDVSDDENDVVLLSDDGEEIVNLSDGERDGESDSDNGGGDRDVQMSPDTDELVQSALNTAFSSSGIQIVDNRHRHTYTSDEVMILGDESVADSRPRRSPRTRTETRSSQESSDDNLVFTIGRSNRGETRRLSANNSSIVITNNNNQPSSSGSSSDVQPPSANTRSRTRTRSPSNETEDPWITPPESIPQARLSRIARRPRQGPVSRVLVNPTQSSSDNSHWQGNVPQSRPSCRGARRRQVVASQVVVNPNQSAAPSSSLPRTMSDSDPIEILSSQTRQIPRRPHTGTSLSANSRDLGDGQPSTSSGTSARSRQYPHVRRPRNRDNYLSVSTQVIINGVPIQGVWGEHPPGLLASMQLASLQRIIPGTAAFGHRMPMTYESMIALDDAHTLEPGQGLTQLDISQNTLTKTYDNTEQNGANSSCNICLSEFDQGEKVRTLPCFHVFHASCIDNWLDRKPECPVCRSKVGR